MSPPPCPTLLLVQLLWLRVRPGARQFLAQMSEMFGDRLFVYTHASLAYARRIMSVLDPRKSIFGDRVLATDLGKRLQENPFDSKGKTLDEAAQFADRFVPFIGGVHDAPFDGGGGAVLDARNCLVLDDRADAWAWGADGGGAGLLGDPNNRWSLLEGNGLIECLPYYFWGFSPAAAESHDRDGLWSFNPVFMAPGGNDSTALASLGLAVSNVKASYDRAAAQKARAEAIGAASGTGEPAKSSTRSDPRKRRGLSKAPDTRVAAALVRRRVLSGCVIVFSAVIPIGDKPETSRYWMMAETFGARCEYSISNSTTHLVAVRDGTAKVATACAQGSVAVVQLSWLVQSCARYERVDEALCPLLPARD